MLTDPPYGLASATTITRRGGKFGSSTDLNAQFAWDRPVDFAWVKECFRVLRPSGVFIGIERDFLPKLARLQAVIAEWAGSSPAHIVVFTRERMPYVLHGPRGRVVILVRQQRMPAVLYAVDKKGHRTAIRWNGRRISYFTDRDGKLRIWDYT